MSKSLENSEVFALTNRICDTIFTVRKQLLDSAVQTPKSLAKGISEILDQFEEAVNGLRRDLEASAREAANGSTAPLSAAPLPEGSRDSLTSGPVKSTTAICAEDIAETP